MVKNRQLFDKAVLISLCAMIFTLPFSKSMVEIFFIIALTCWVIKHFIIYYSSAHRVSLLKALAPVYTELNLPMALFVLIGFLSTIGSVSLPLSLEGFFFKLFEWIMIYFIVAESISTKEKVNLILKVIIASALLVGIDGIFQLVTGADFLRNYPVQGYRVIACFDTPNGFAAWLIIMLPLAFSLAYFSKSSKKALLWILVCILIFGFVLTYSRSALIAVLLSFVLLGLFRSKRLFVISIILVLILPFIAPHYIKERMKASMIDDVRVTLWQEALNITADYPILGSGLNTYASIAPKYKLTEETGCYPHNSYLQMAAESGLLGLGAFLWILIALFRTSLINVKRINDKFYEAVLVGLLAGLFGFLVHSFFDVNIYTLQLGNLMWFIMGLIVAVQRVALQKNLP